jgi:ferritin
MLNEKIQEAFNRQLNAEAFSAYLYLSMSAWFDSINLAGMANWMKLQAGEELEHAMKFYAQIQERGGTVTLSQIDTPQAAWDSPLAAFEAAYEHEQKVTGMINELVDLAISENDHAANAFLQWFVTEQVEEEDTALSIVEQLRLVGDSRGALFMIDRELGQRGGSAGEEEE